MKQFSASPVELFATLVRHRSLVVSMVKRDVIGRYRGSAMGLLWSFFNPLLMLLVYTFVFSVVFNSRWGKGADESTISFGIVLFVGMIVHGIFADCVNRAPSLVLSSPNYVKKVVFPLEVLAWVALGSALFHAGVSVVMLGAANLLAGGEASWTMALLPFAMFPVLPYTVGFCWALASLGVYFRDIGQITGVFTTVLMFLSPVFYPVSSLPTDLQWILNLNPLTVVIEDCRDVFLFGKVPSVERWLITLVVGLIVAWLGFAWFQKTRKGFADVI